ncbi:MAG: ribonuclease E/G, partial [Waterburya sp.]
LNRDDDFIQRVLRDTFSGEVNTIVVDSAAGVKRVKQQLMNWSGGRSPQGVFIDYHREQQPILDYYRVSAAVREALKPRVELPSGGYIIIEPTEALTVIDVNSGSFTRSATARETVLWTNTEAATEIARQLRLRNIGGVIVVDFIDMDSHRDKIKLLEHFNKSLKGDKARPQIAQLSELGLVELTRKRQGKNIYELFGQTCPTCGGLGQIAHLPGKSEAEALETAPIVPPAAIREPLSSVRPVIPAPIERQEKLEIASSLIPELGYESANRQLDLLNHPNYQEQAGTNNGNRRRRRSRRNDLLIKDDLIEQEGTEAIAISVVPELDNNEERKTRSQLRSPRREEANLEKVTVEMPALEQEIYALMGISPLVYAQQEVKDSRSVLVYVKQPGEELVEPSSTATSSEAEPAKPELQLPIRTRRTSSSAKSTPDVPEIDEIKLELEMSKESETESELSVQEDLPTTGRRRRRRSSVATENS